MNPLNVLRGRSLMTPGRVAPPTMARCMLDRGGPRAPAARRRGPPGRRHPRRPRRQARRPPTARRALAPADRVRHRSSRRSTSRCARRSRCAAPTGNPIVLVDQLGRIAGLCGDDEIYRGLLRRQCWASRPPPPDGPRPRSSTSAKTRSGPDGVRDHAQRPMPRSDNARIVHSRQQAARHAAAAISCGSPPPRTPRIGIITARDEPCMRAVPPPSCVLRLLSSRWECHRSTPVACGDSGSRPRQWQARSERTACDVSGRQPRGSRPGIRAGTCRIFDHVPAHHATMPSPRR